MKEKEAKRLIAKWEKEDKLEGRPPQARPTIEQLCSDDLEYWWKHSYQARMAKYRLPKEYAEYIMKSIYQEEYLAYYEIEPYEKQWKYLEALLKKEWFR